MMWILLPRGGGREEVVITLTKGNIISAMRCYLHVHITGSREVRLVS